MEQKVERSETVEGVRIVSRYGIARELRRMRRSVESWPDHLRESVNEFFCDSKAGQHYLIDLRDRDHADKIAAFLPPLRSAYVGFDFRGERVLEMRGW